MDDVLGAAWSRQRLDENAEFFAFAHEARKPETRPFPPPKPPLLPFGHKAPDDREKKCFCRCVFYVLVRGLRLCIGSSRQAGEC